MTHQGDVLMITIGSLRALLWAIMNPLTKVKGGRLFGCIHICEYVHHNLPPCARIQVNTMGIEREPSSVVTGGSCHSNTDALEPWLRLHIHCYLSSRSTICVC